MGTKAMAQCPPVDDYSVLVLALPSGGRKKEARRQAKRAAKLLGRGSSGWLRAEDIKQAAKKKN